MARGELPHVRFFPSQFMVGVRGLTPAEVGAYMMVLCRIYEADGPVLADMEILAAYCSMRPDHFTKAFDRLVRLGKFEVSEGMVFNARAGIEIEARRKAVNMAFQRGKASAEKRQQNQGGGAKAFGDAFNYKDKDKEKKEREVSSDTSPKKDPAKKGSRLSADWRLPKDWGDWALTEGNFTVDDVRRIADRFGDYWRGVAGAKGVKLDWLATWRNWVRKEIDDGKRKPRRGASEFDAKIREVARKIGSGEIDAGSDGSDPFGK